MLGGGVVVAGAGPAGADEGGALAFRATAEAAAVRMTMTVANGPGTNDPIDVPGPISHAAVNSLGSSSAFASFPYPGDAGVTVPGLLPAVVPGVPSLPPYPFYAKSEYPISPEAQQAAGAVNLSAESTQTASKAAGSAGPQGDGPGSMSSEASVAEVRQPYLAPGTAAVVATSKAVVAAFAAGPLTLGRVVSTASVMLLPDGTLQRKSGLELSGIRIGDQSVGLSSNGFVVPGAGVPFPAGVQDQLLGALAGGGMTVEFLPERQTDDQMSYLMSGGVLGLFLLGLGATLWLSADLRDEWRKMDHLQASVDALSATLATAGTAAELSLPDSSLVDA